MESYVQFMEALANASGQPQRSFSALELLAEQTVGCRLFTLMSFDPEVGEGCRFHSNMPDKYPVTGRKPVPEGPWAETVVRNREIFVANSIVAIAAVFPDHELIASLGCGAVINIPVIAAGRLLGCVNCLDSAGSYGPERVLAARRLMLPGAACFLLAGTLSKPGDQQ